MNKTMRQPSKIGTYKQEDVLFLLKDLSHARLEERVEIREKSIQAGHHYSETLPIEYQPPKEYMELFWKTLNDYREKVALCTGIVAEQIYSKHGKSTVLVSLARAGTPVGILIKRYLQSRFHISVPHYSISIIREMGVDENALQYVLKHHPGCYIQFVDGWTGKGAISLELSKACKTFHEKYGVFLDDTLAVLADPGFCTKLYGTREDFLIPSACLNSTVSGLVSRTILNKKFIGIDDFHGAKFYSELIDLDVSNEFIDRISSEFSKIYEKAADIAQKRTKENIEVEFLGMKDVRKIQEEFQIPHSNFIKPGVGETTRVLLRRIPWKILVRDLSSPYVKHILMLAKEKNVEIVSYPNLNYLCCGLVKSLKNLGI
ncbi:MAG: cysteine protease StiP family protein [Bacillota bacterium]|nr:cysteine protease StiP family protein [Bacillota bacterium]